MPHSECHTPHWGCELSISTSCASGSASFSSRCSAFRFSSSSSISRTSSTPTWAAASRRAPSRCRTCSTYPRRCFSCCRSPFCSRPCSRWARWAALRRRALELRTREMADRILEREGTGDAYPTIVLAAQRAIYSDTGKGATKPPRWTLHRGTIRYFEGSQPEGEFAFEFDSLRSRTLKETPADLLAEPKAPDEMRYGELDRYIEALARSGSNVKKLQVELALKIAIPFICLLIALFGAPLAISSPKSGAAWGVAASLATTFIVLLMFQLAKAVGAGGVLPPLVAAWTPNLLVAVSAVYLLRKAPT